MTTETGICPYCNERVEVPVESDAASGIAYPEHVTCSACGKKSRVVTDMHEGRHYFLGLHKLDDD